MALDPFTVTYYPLNEPLPRQSGTPGQVGEYWVRWEGRFPDGTAQIFNLYYRKDEDGNWTQVRPLHKTDEK